MAASVSYDFTQNRTTSTGPMVAGSSVAQTELVLTPSGVMRVRPFSRSAARCLPLATRCTSDCAAASRLPRYEPTAPAPMTATRVTSDALERGRDRSAAAEAQGREAVVALAPAQLVQQGRDDSRSRGADGMAERDGPAVDVDLVPVEAELAPVGDGLRGECLVDLDEVEVADGHVELLEQLADALHG